MSTTSPNPTRTNPILPNPILPNPTRPNRTRSRRTRVAVAFTAGVVAALALAGCSSGNDGLASQYKGGTTQNYISGDGAVTEVAAAKRDKAVDFTATTTDGDTVSSAELKGKVVVLNFWYAGCPPCRAEAKNLNKVYASHKGDDVQFIGVNVRDQKASAAAFERTFDVQYPTVLDADKGTMQLALSGTIAPNSVPTTIVLDKQGRVAARILGAVDAPSILDTLVGDELSGNA